VDVTERVRGTNTTFLLSKFIPSSLTEVTAAMKNPTWETKSLPEGQDKACHLRYPKFLHSALKIPFTDVYPEIDEFP
jgi:hypothetical protein